MKIHFQLKRIILKHGRETNEHVKSCCPQGLSRTFSLDSSLGLTLPAFRSPRKNLCFCHSVICNRNKNPSAYIRNASETPWLAGAWGRWADVCVKHPKSYMYFGKHTYASSLRLSWRRYSRHAARGSVPFLPDVSPAEYEPRVVPTQNPLSIGVWKGLNWLHLFGTSKQDWTQLTKDLCVASGVVTESHKPSWC